MKLRVKGPTGATYEELLSKTGIQNDTNLCQTQLWRWRASLSASSAPPPRWQGLAPELQAQSERGFAGWAAQRQWPVSAAAQSGWAGPGMSARWGWWSARSRWRSRTPGRAPRVLLTAWLEGKQQHSQGLRSSSTAHILPLGMA